MLELLLNAVWFALAGGAVTALLRAHGCDSERKRLLLRLGALLCASALLFPAISITDDLHYDAFLIEDSSSTKRIVSAITHSSPVGDLAWFGFVAFAFLLLLRRRTWNILVPKFSVYRTPLLIHPLRGRAPPSAFLG